MSTILIADDDPLMVRLLQFNLGRAGYELVICREGLSAEREARARRPDAAVIDVMLPGKTGQELIETFRADKDLADMPVIVVTGHGEKQVHVALLAAGAQRVFTKPFAPSLLLVAVEELIQGGPA